MSVAGRSVSSLELYKKQLHKENSVFQMFSLGHTKCKLLIFVQFAGLCKVIFIKKRSWQREASYLHDRSCLEKPYSGISKSE